MTRYTILVEAPEPDDVPGNFSAYSPDVPGCVATGATESACVDAMVEALEMHLAGLAEDGIPAPPRRRAGRRRSM